jgi:hypothetical protein
MDPDAYCFDLVPAQGLRFVSLLEGWMRVGGQRTMIEEFTVKGQHTTVTLRLDPGDADAAHLIASVPRHEGSMNLYHP